MRYQFIQKHRSSFTVTKMCRTFNIFPSGFYRWQKKPYSNRQKENNRIREGIRRLYDEHKGMAGSPMITADLRSEPGFEGVGKNRVARHMRAMGLRCKTLKKFIATTDSKHKEPVAENLLNKKFLVSSPNSVWVSDISVPQKAA